MKPSQTVGERIRALRAERGLTQEALAAACGVSRSAVAQWETDRAGQLRAHLTRVAAVLGCKVEYLLSGAAAPAADTGDEMAMLRLYRECSTEDRTFLLRTARKLASVNS